jgi:small-conductance mechanosensitive channel
MDSRVTIGSAQQGSSSTEIRRKEHMSVLGHSLEVLNASFLGNSLSRWLCAIGVMLFTAVLGRAALRAFVRNLSQWTAKTNNPWDDSVLDVLRRTHTFFFIAMGAYAAFHVLHASARVHSAVVLTVKLALLVQGALWIQTVATEMLTQWNQQRQSLDAGTSTMLGAIRFLGQLILWSVVLVLILSNLGVEVGALITGLGVGGVAAALAVQNVLRDLFASLALYFDRPFNLGDPIAVGDIVGPVEKIGIRSTHVRSLSGEQVILPNSDLSEHRIRNFKRMTERRVVFDIGVVYETRHATLTEIPEIVRRCVEQTPNTRFDRCHFKTFGASALHFETVYYVTSPDYNVFMDAQQAVNLAIVQHFEARNIQFAYPTQTVHVRNPEATQT